MSVPQPPSTFTAPPDSSVPFMRRAHQFYAIQPGARMTPPDTVYSGWRAETEVQKYPFPGVEPRMNLVQVFVGAIVVAAMLAALAAVLWRDRR